MANDTNPLAEARKIADGMQRYYREMMGQARAQRLRDAGFTPRDTRLTCEECGAKVTAQMLPIHKCRT